MSAPIQTPEQVLGQQFDPVELSYVEGLYSEGLAMPNANERDRHLAEVAELIGDLALYDLLGEKVARDREIAESLAEGFRNKRALEAAAKIESRGYAESAPSFEEQLSDDSRGKKFKYNHLPPHMEMDGWEEKTMTEVEGLRDLDAFLSFFLAATTWGDGSHLFPDEVEQAQSILDNLTFIGEKEYDEAARGIASLWKAYLDADPNRKLCVLAKVSNSAKYPGKRKSDDYLKERVFGNFTEDDKQRYSGRIMSELESMEAESPDDVRVILLDDWTISGRQLNRVVKSIADDPIQAKFIDSIEANLIVASKDRINNGLHDPDDPSRKPIRVRAYYESKHAEKAATGNKGHVSGLHSTVNFDFGDTIEKMIKRLNQLGIVYELPALASIVRSYRKERPKARMQ